MDYISVPITTTFTAGTTITTVNVAVIMDDILEKSETFDVTFTIPPSLKYQVIPGAISEAVGIITDSTGNIFVILSTNYV